MQSIWVQLKQRVYAWARFDERKFKVFDDQESIAKRGIILAWNVSRLSRIRKLISYRRCATLSGPSYGMPRAFRSSARERICYESLSTNGEAHVEVLAGAAAVSGTSSWWTP